MTPDEDRVFLYLHSSKDMSNWSSSWRATSNEVINQVLKWLNEREPTSINSPARLREVILSLEDKVRRYKVRSAIHVIICSSLSFYNASELTMYFFPWSQLDEAPLNNKDTMLLVFDYIGTTLVLPSDSDEVPETDTENAGPSNTKRVKTSSHAASSCMSPDSIQPQLYEVCHGPYNMGDCTEKLERLGFDGEAFFDAIDFFTNDLQRRQVFMKLEDRKAFIYASRQLSK